MLLPLPPVFSACTHVPDEHTRGEAPLTGQRTDFLQVRPSLPILAVTGHSHPPAPTVGICNAETVASLCQSLGQPGAAGLTPGGFGLSYPLCPGPLAHDDDFWEGEAPRHLGVGLRGGRPGPGLSAPAEAWVGSAFGTWPLAPFILMTDPLGLALDCVVRGQG